MVYESDMTTAGFLPISPFGSMQFLTVVSKQIRGGSAASAALRRRPSQPARCSFGHRLAHEPIAQVRPYDPLRKLPVSVTIRSVRLR